MTHKILEDAWEKLTGREKPVRDAQDGPLDEKAKKVLEKFGLLKGEADEPTADVPEPEESDG